MGSQIVGILGLRKFWLVGFKNGKIRGKKKVVTETTLALLILYLLVTLQSVLKLQLII